jgi:hypothetical protein
MPQENPPLLDKTMNTTEQTPRNLADVLADELVISDLVTQATAIVTKLQALINAVKPNASDIPLDPITGMSANNVQSGISELKGTLDGITVKYSGTANSQGMVVTDIDFTNKIRSVYADNRTLGAKLYCLIRPSNSNKVVAMPISDSLAKGASNGDSVDIYISMINS